MAEWNLSGLFRRSHTRSFTSISWKGAKMVSACWPFKMECIILRWDLFASQVRTNRKVWTSSYGTHLHRSPYGISNIRDPPEAISCEIGRNGLDEYIAARFSSRSVTTRAEFKCTMVFPPKETVNISPYLRAISTPHIPPGNGTSNELPMKGHPGTGFGSLYFLLYFMVATTWRTIMQKQNPIKATTL